MNELIDLYVELLKWDIAVMSQGWMYLFVLPIMFFLPFFFLKWIILTAPLWLPFGMIYAAASKK